MRWVCVSEFVHVRRREERASDSAWNKIDLEVGGSGSVYVWRQDERRQVGGWVDQRVEGVQAGGQGCSGGYQDRGQAVKQVLMTSPGVEGVHPPSRYNWFLPPIPDAGRSLARTGSHAFLTSPPHPDSPFFCLTPSAFLEV